MNERDRKKFSTKKMQQMLVWWVNELPDGLDLNLSVPPPANYFKRCPECIFSRWLVVRWRLKNWLMALHYITTLLNFDLNLEIKYFKDEVPLERLNKSHKK